MTKISEYNVRFEIQEPSLTTDGNGLKTTTYNKTGYVWGKVENSPGMLQRVQTADGEYNITHRITVRYTSTITKTSRLVYNNYEYIICRYNEKTLGHKKELELYCEQTDPSL